jgi:hypothetical protein
MLLRTEKNTAKFPYSELFKNTLDLLKLDQDG